MTDKPYRQAAPERTGKLPSESELKKRFEHAVMYGNGDFIAWSPERFDIRADREPAEPVTTPLEPEPDDE